MENDLIKKVKERIATAFSKNLFGKIRDITSLRVLPEICEKTKLDELFLYTLRNAYEYKGKRQNPILKVSHGCFLNDLDTGLILAYSSLSDFASVNMGGRTLFCEYHPSDCLSRLFRIEPRVETYIPGKWEDRVEQLTNPDYLRETLTRYSKIVSDWIKESRETELKKKFGLE